MNPDSFLSLMQKPGKPCLHPWFYLWLNAASDITVCPQNRTRLGSLEDLSFDDIWNGEKIKKIRRLFLAEEYEQAGCEKECPYLRGCYSHAQQPIPKEELIFPDIEIGALKMAQPAYENLLQCRSAYEQQSELVQAEPAILDSQVVLRCNADCIMCGQPHQSRLGHSQQIKQKVFALSKYLAVIRWQGGEVFMDKQFINDQIKLTESGHEQLSIIIITNGSLLSRERVDRLLELKGRIKFIVSMDGATRETVNRIRYRLKFDVILATIEYLAKKQRLTDRKIVLWNYTVMASNIDEVLQALQMAEQLDVDINLAAIQGDYPNENLFRYDLVPEQDWRRYLHRWKDAARSSGVMVSGLEGLERRFQIRKDLRSERAVSN